jgi:DNA polymerase sigma
MLGLAEAKIDQKKKLILEAEALARKKAKPKKKKKKPAVVPQGEATATNATASEQKSSDSRDKEKENLAGRERDAPHDLTIRTLYQRREDLMLRLHQEVEEYVKYTKYVIETTYNPRAEAMIEKIHSTVTSIWQSAYVKVYGSCATSLCIASSDLDLVVMGAGNPLSAPGQQLRLLGKALEYELLLFDN